MLAFASVLCFLPMSCGKTDDEDEKNAVTIDDYGDGIIFGIKGVSFNMRKIYGGTFQMGTTLEDDDQAFNEETVVHNVTLSNYYIGETEVTQALWDKVAGNNPSHFSGASLPVERVSYDMITQKFIPVLNNLTGKTFRLPTEAEWEFAAKGGNDATGYRYSGSNDASEVSWHNGNSQNQTHSVKSKRCNEQYLYDMSGNVWEWCQDWHGLYSDTAQTNPQGPATGQFRIVRGGAWSDGVRYSRTTCRMRYLPGAQNHFLGFRLAMNAD